MVYTPASFDSTPDLMLVSMLVASMVAFGTTAPVESVTVPVTVAKVVWAASEAAPRSAARTAAQIENVRSISPPLGGGRFPTRIYLRARGGQELTGLLV